VRKIGNLAKCMMAFGGSRCDLQVRCAGANHQKSHLQDLRGGGFGKMVIGKTYSYKGFNVGAYVQNSAKNNTTS